MGKTIDGRGIALNIKEDIKKFIASRQSYGLAVPKIASILVGNDGGSIYYMNSQEKVAEALGCRFDKIILDENASEAEVIEKIRKLNLDDEVNGIIVQLPLPDSLDEEKVLSNISIMKDIDCLTYESQGRLYMGKFNYLPCTPNSIVTILDSLNIDLEGKEIVVMGRSNIVGKPVAKMLLDKNATVTIVHSRSSDIKKITKRADILITAIGKPKLVNTDYIKEGAIIIDVGTTSVNGKITGDVDFENVIEKAAFITPVPGGVGALTTTLLIKNACEALLKNEN